MKLKDLTYQIIGAAYTVHGKLGSGFLENVYENAMVVELSKRGLSVVSQHSINVYYDEVLVGEYSADLFVNDEVIVELKAVTKLIKKHEVQLVNYLTATKKDIGLLINFGESVDVKKKFREYKK